MAALECAAQGVKATKAVHICYGYGTADVKRWKSANRDWSHYESTLPLLAKSSIDQVSIETAASGVDVGVIDLLRGKDVLLGVVDVGNEIVETPELIAQRLHAALRYTDPGHRRLHGLRHAAAVPQGSRRQTARTCWWRGIGERDALVRATGRRPNGAAVVRMGERHGQRSFD